GKPNDAGPQPNKSSGSGLTPNCEKQLRRTADLLRFFANRVQGGEEIQSVVGDVRQHEKRLSAVCPDLSDRGKSSNDCTKEPAAHNMSDQCGARFPDLSRVLVVGAGAHPILRSLIN